MSMPAFYRPLLRHIGTLAIPGSTERDATSADYTVTYVPEPGNDLRQIVRSISGEVLGEIAGIVADELEVHAFVGKRGDVAELYERVADLLKVADWKGKIPDPVAAAQALCVRLGLGFAAEEFCDVPIGGWGQGSMVLGRGKIQLREGWIDQ